MSFRRMLGYIFLLIGVPVVLLMGWLYLAQRQIIFPAPAGPIPQELGPGVEQISLEQGHAILALPSRRVGLAPLIVFTHGNAELAHWSLDSFQFFRDRGMAVLLVEYPGYGGTVGSPSLDSIEQTVLAALDRVLMRDDIDRDRVVAYGRSIGSGPASLVAGQRQVAALVLEAPFYTLSRLVSDHSYPAFLLRDRFDNAAVVASLNAPIFLYHGIDDAIIPHRHSEDLQALNPRAFLLSVDCGHNDCPRPWEALEAFLMSHGVLQ